LLTTINDILDLSKIEAGQLHLEYEPFSIRKCIRDSIEICLPRLDTSKVEFRESIEEGIPEHICGDAYRVSQITVNLLSNAFKYTASGTVSLKLSGSLIGEYLIRLSLTVEDSGIGISEENQLNVFEPFTQADASITRQFGGTGLGLTICKRLAESMNGDISVESVLGDGSRFVFIWTADLENKPDKDKQLSDNRADLNFAGIKTLVVEDNPINLKVIELSLRKLGVEVSKVVNGLEAVNKLSEERFDLIFMDIQMPVMDGLSATRKIREQISEEDQPFIVALTAHALEDNLQQYREAKINGFLAKPFMMNELERTLSVFRENELGDRSDVCF